MQRIRSECRELTQHRVETVMVVMVEANTSMTTELNKVSVTTPMQTTAGLQEIDQHAKFAGRHDM